MTKLFGPIAFATVALGSLFGACGEEKPNASKASNPTASRPTPEPSEAAPLGAPLRVPMELEAVDLTQPFSWDLRQGVSFRNAQTLVKWSSPSGEIVAVKNPLRATLNSLSPIYRSVCDPKHRAVVSAFAQWCVHSPSSLSLTLFKYSENQGGELAAQIPEKARDTSLPHIVGASENWVVLRNTKGVIALNRNTNKTMQIASLEYPQGLSAQDRSSAVGGVFDRSKEGKKPIVWIQTPGRVFFSDTHETSAPDWREVQFQFSGVSQEVIKKSKTLAFIKELKANEPQWGVALSDQNRLHLTKGMVTSAAPPPVPTIAPGPNDNTQEDPYWSAKGRALVSQYCTGCHNHSFGQNPPDVDLFKAQKETILQRTSLQTGQTGVMPPYGAPRVPAASLTELQDWLRQLP